MSELLAIIVVVDSSRGHHFVLQFPNTLNPDSFESKFKETGFPVSESRRSDVFQYQQSTSKQVRKESIDKSLCDTSIAEKANSEISTQNEEDINYGLAYNGDSEDTREPNLYDTVLGFDTSLISNLFSPKPALCNKRFQLGIQNLTFLGLPTQVNFNSSNSLETAPYSSMYKNEINGENFFTGDSSTKSIPQSPDAQSSGTKDLSLQNYNKRTSTSTCSQITMFHIVFVLQPSPFKDKEDILSFGDSLYTNIITPYTAALKHEQMRCNYIGQNTETIISLTENAIAQGHSRDVLMRNILQASPLAHDIAHLFQSITESSVAQLCINNYLHLALQIPPCPFDLAPYWTSNKSSLHSARNRDISTSLTNVHPSQTSLVHNNILDTSVVPDPGSFSQNSMTNPHTTSPHSPSLHRQISGFYKPPQRLPTFRPYHTLLLLETPEDLLRTLPPDASPKLIRLIHILTPTQRLAAHLIYWRKARLIDVISVRNVYTLAPKKSHSISFDILSEEFSNLFPQMSLDEILAFLSMPRPYSLIIPNKEQRTLYLEIIAFLLRREVAVPLHTYIFFMIPQYIKKGYHTEDFENWISQSQLPNSSSIGNSRVSLCAPGGLDGISFDGIALVSIPSQMMEAEREWIKKIANSQPKEVAALFQRLVKYFNGQYHVDEIVYFESITRRELRAILSRFREELITVLHYRGLGELSNSTYQL